MDVNYNTQSALSIPLSNIVESGDNYIRFSNGTQMVMMHLNYQYNNLNITDATEIRGYSKNVYITWPVKFISQPYCFVTSTNSGCSWNTSSWYMSESIDIISAWPSATGCSVTASAPKYYPTGAKLTDFRLLADILAIGKWK